MLYYYNRDGKFQKESSREYKTEKGAVEKLQKEGQGAVFDETGQLVLSLNERIRVADAETVAESQDQSDGEQHEPEPLTFDGMEELVESHEMKKAEQAGETSFAIQTACDVLRIRAGAGKDHRIVGYIREKDGSKKIHVIVEEKNGWGKLSSGEGWIDLAFVQKIN